MEKVLGAVVTVIVFILLPESPVFDAPVVTFIAFMINCIISAIAGLVVSKIAYDLKG